MATLIRRGYVSGTVVTYLRMSTICILQLGLPVLMFLTLMPMTCNAGGEKNMSKASIREITYHFGDASVPPEYHRSYTVTVTADKARIVIDSYGQILADKRYEITEKQFNDLRNSIEKNRLRNCMLGEDEGCSGGTVEKLSYSDGENEIFSGSVYHCGGKDTGNLCGDIKSFAEEVKNVLPNFHELLL